MLVIFINQYLFVFFSISNYLHYMLYQIALLSAVLFFVYLQNKNKNSSNLAFDLSLQHDSISTIYLKAAGLVFVFLISSFINFVFLHIFLFWHLLLHILNWLFWLHFCGNVAFDVSFYDKKRRRLIAYTYKRCQLKAHGYMSKIWISSMSVVF